MIKILGLDIGYEDCIKQMEGEIKYFSAYTNEMDVVLPETVEFHTDKGSYNFTSPTVGMVLESREFEQIVIL